MSRPVHVMIRVRDDEASLAFYQRAFGFSIADRFDFPDFSLIYLRHSTSPFELELTLNRGRDRPYDLGDGYGHFALTVEDLEATHRDQKAGGFAPGDIKQMQHGDRLLARFYFIQDPDGYKVEVIERHGRFL